MCAESSNFQNAPKVMGGSSLEGQDQKEKPAAPEIFTESDEGLKTKNKSQNENKATKGTVALKFAVPVQSLLDFDDLDFYESSSFDVLEPTRPSALIESTEFISLATGLEEEVEQSQSEVAVRTYHVTMHQQCGSPGSISKRPIETRSNYIFHKGCPS